MNPELNIVLIFFFLFLIALAFVININGGLFWARMPWRPSDYKPTDQNEVERKAGLAFVNFAFKSSAIALPILLLLYDSLLTKLVGVLLILGIVLYTHKNK